MAATTQALAEQHQRDPPWCFNRKQPAIHGEGGTLVGALSGWNIDDVIIAAAGTAIREAMQIIDAQAPGAAAC